MCAVGDSPVLISTPSVPPPPCKVEKKKKWATVASANYFRDGGHVETKWGKFGEAGQNGGGGDSEDDDEPSEPSEDEVNRLYIMDVNRFYVDGKND